MAQNNERAPSVLIAVMTKQGLRKNEDGQSFHIDEIGNGLLVEAGVQAGDLVEIPFYVLAVGGRPGRNLRVGITVEYPDGYRGVFTPDEDAVKTVKSTQGAVEWFVGIGIPFRMTGVHWVRVSINSAFKTEAPVNIQVAGGIEMTAVSFFQA